MTRSAKGTLYIAPQPSGYGGTDPSTNGSGYTYVPTCGGPATKVDEKAQLPTNYASGSVYESTPEPGPDHATVSFKTHLGGFGTAGGDGTSPPAVDHLDILANAAFATAVARSGEGVSTASTTTSLVMDTDIYSIYDLVPVYEAGLAAGRTQWVRVNADPGSGTYTVAPTMTTAPTTAAVAYATNNWRPGVSGGAYVAGVFVDDDLGACTLLSGRVVLDSIEADAGGLYVASWRILFDTKSMPDAAKTNLPNPTAGPAFAALRATRSPVWFANVQYETSKVSIQMNPTIVVIGATSAAQGRAGEELLAYKPRIVIEPLRAYQLDDLKRNVNEGAAQVQIGAGILTGGYLGSWVMHFDNAYVAEARDTDDQGVARNQVTIVMSDAANFSGAGPATRAPQFQMARA